MEKTSIIWVLSENRLNPIVPKCFAAKCFADHYPVTKWLAIIGKINPTFSDIPVYGHCSSKPKTNKLGHLGPPRDPWGFNRFNHHQHMGCPGYRF